jgi:hypothetical protein
MWRDRANDETCPASNPGCGAGIGEGWLSEADLQGLQRFPPFRDAIWPIPIGGPEEARRANTHASAHTEGSR